MKDESLNFEIDYIKKTYDREKIRYERAVNGVEREIKEYFNDIFAEGIHYIKGRVKSKESIIEKLLIKRYKDGLEQMKDVGGLRIVCHNDSDVEQVIAFIRSRYKNSIIEDEKIERKDGYRAHHFVVNIQVLVAGIPHGTKVEIQIRTIAQDLFDTLSRRDMYKHPGILPEDWIKGMKDLSDKLREVDRIAEDLKQKWIKENIVTKGKDQLSAQTIIHICKGKLGEDITMEKALNCLQNLVRYGIIKISDLESTLENKEVMEELDSIYLKLLKRKADTNGKVIYGALMNKFSLPLRPFAINIIVMSIEASEEYKRLQSKNLRRLGENFQWSIDDI